MDLIAATKADGVLVFTQKMGMFEKKLSLSPIISYSTLLYLPLRLFLGLISILNLFSNKKLCRSVSFQDFYGISLFVSQPQRQHNTTQPQHCAVVGLDMKMTVQTTETQW